MRRRDAILLLGATALGVPCKAGAQASARTPLVAVLDDAAEDVQRESWASFRRRLAELGYHEGRNLKIEARYARGATERLPALAKELVDLKPDVLVCPNTPTTQAARRATSSVPIVFIGPTNPVELGLVNSLARPGGNITGLSNMATDLAPKWLEVIRELVPGAKRIAYVSDTSNKGAVLVFEQLRGVGQPMNIEIQMLNVRQAADVERVFESVARERIDGLIVGAASIVLRQSARVIEFAARQRVPVLYARREYADAGGLIFYGIDVVAMYTRAADYVDKIARGAKPAELPVEQPNVFRMVLNMNTARALGMPIPQAIRLRADEVIG